MNESQASTIYVSGETAKLAKEIEDLTGLKASRLFREFVQQYRRTTNPSFSASIDSLAFIVPSLPPWDVKGPHPFLSSKPSSSIPINDIFNHIFDSAYPQVFKAFLMGKSLEHPITNHVDIWSDFVKSGGELEVLLQGDISSGLDKSPRLYAANDPALNDSKLLSRRRTIEVLKELSITPPGRVVVRNSGQTLITMNAGAMFRVDGTVDMYLEFVLGETGEINRSSTIVMTARHDPPDDKYRLVAGSMEGIWLRSLPEVGFDSNQ
jgi:hypothetical protein